MVSFKHQTAKVIFYWLGSILSVLSFSIGLLWAFDRPLGFFDKSNYEPFGIVFLLASTGCFAIGKFLTWLYTSQNKVSISKKQVQRNRKDMLELVKNIWVEGFLKESLHNEVLIRLGLAERKDAVNRSWEAVLRTVEQPNYVLPPGTRIIDVFEKMNRSLLILGEPGSGKTTILLELAQDTIYRAERDPCQRIPVVFNLSSWIDPKQSLADWLINELNTKYNVPKKLARFWVMNDELLLLLDGLDEVASERRKMCITHINAFRHEHLVPLAICSRLADYEAIDTKLNLQGAVLLEPLASQQIDSYFSRMGPELEAARIALKEDITLQELIDTPLMLNIMTLTYRNDSVKDISLFDSTGSRQEHLFNTYIRKMSTYRSDNIHYSPRQSIYWLKWLAQKMLHSNQTFFFIEEIQPTWLQSKFQKSLYNIIGGLFTWLVFWLGFVLPSWLTDISGLEWEWLGRLAPDKSQELFSNDSSYLTTALNLGLLSGLAHMTFGWLITKTKLVEKLRWLGKEVIIGLLGGLILGGVGAFFFSESVSKLFYRLDLGVSVGLYGGLVYLTLTWLISKAKLTKKWKWFKSDGRIKKSLIIGLLGGLIIPLKMFEGLLVGLLVELFGGLSYAALAWLISKAKLAEKFNWFGVKKSRKFGLILGLISGLFLGLGVGLYTGLTSTPILGLFFGLTLSLLWGVICGLISGTIFEQQDRIKRVEKLKWSGREVKKSLKFGLIIGIIAGLVFGFLFGVALGLDEGVVVGLVMGLIVGLIAVLVRQSNVSNSIETRTIPNQGIWLTAKNAFFYGLLSGLIIWLPSILFAGVIIRLSNEPTLREYILNFVIYSLGTGLMLALIVSLVGGGIAVIHHFILRFILSIKRYMPWNYARFLNYATERIFLRRVGGGYVFMHRLLMEHFANMKTEQIKTLYSTHA